MLVKDKSDPRLYRCVIHDGHKEGLQVVASSEGRFEQCEFFANALAGVLVIAKLEARLPALRAPSWHRERHHGDARRRRGSSSIARSPIMRERRCWSGINRSRASSAATS